MFAAEKYIRSEFEKMGYEVRLQEVHSEKNVYHNIIARYGHKDAKELVVIGAHYDTCEKDNPGADDNASGVAGLLELAKIFIQQKPELTTPIEFVAYTLEEPPYFGSDGMGSAYHAEELATQKIDVKYMISLEMLGYYSDELFSQEYPFGFFYTMYPWRGNYIALVSAPADRELVSNFKKAMAPRTSVPVYSINAPAALPGVDFSDHRSYWAHDWPALMITDTAFLRNNQYHLHGDTPERLNYEKMADVTGGIYEAVISLETKSATNYQSSSNLSFE